MDTQGIAQYNKALAKRLDLLKQASLAVERGKALTARREDELAQAESAQNEELGRRYNIIIARLVSSMLPDEIKPFANDYIGIKNPIGWNEWQKTECMLGFRVPGFAPMEFHITVRSFNQTESMLVEWYMGGNRCVVSVLQTAANRYNNIYEYDQERTAAENVLMAFALAYQTGAQPEPHENEPDFDIVVKSSTPGERLIDALVTFIQAETGA